MAWLAIDRATRPAPLDSRLRGFAFSAVSSDISPVMGGGDHA
jgi:hypothetical protein